MKTADLRIAAWRLVPLLAVLIAVGALGELVGGPPFEREVTQLLIYVTIVVGMYTFIGVSGVLSFGHMSFVMIGAYVTALLTVPVAQKAVLLPDLPLALQRFESHPLLAAAVAGLAAIGFAVVIGIPLMRLRGIAPGMALLATLIIVYTVANQWESVTRGRLTMMGVPRQTDLPRALVFSAIAVGVAYFFSESPIGLRLRASRDDEVAAEAMGVRITADRRIALALSGGILGVGGFLYAQFLGSFNPEAFWLSITFVTLAMLIVGGKNSLTGAVIGVIVIALLSAVLRRVEAGIDIGPIVLPEITGIREIGLAVVMLASLLARPEGISGGQEFWRQRWWRRLAAIAHRERRCLRPRRLHTPETEPTIAPDALSPPSSRRPDEPSTRQ